jgi:hypothetical protein
MRKFRQTPDKHPRQRIEAGPLGAGFNSPLNHRVTESLRSPASLFTEM